MRCLLVLYYTILRQASSWAYHRYERALDIKRLVLGADHPKLVPSLIGLGGALREQQRLDEAAVAMTRAVQLAERAHGGDAEVGAGLAASGGGRGLVFL
jgi:hypothetical protein